MIVMSFITMRKTFLLGGGLLAALALALVAACGGGSDGPSSSGNGPVVCDALRDKSFQYKIASDWTVSELQGTPPAGTTRRSSFHITESIDGQVQDGKDFDVHVINTDGSNRGEYQMMEIGTTGYFYSEGQWDTQDLTIRPEPIRYRPLPLCNALSYDVVNATDTGRTEDINGIESKVFTLSSSPVQVFAHIPEFGPSSDQATYITKLEGTVWVSKDDSYITKADFTGSGAYDSGQLTSIHMTFEVTKMGADVSLKAPV
jgi:hypothetical protein